MRALVRTQRRDVLSGKPDPRLMSLSEQAKAFKDYTVIRDGNISNFEGDIRS